jgi:hypothetical protein
MTAPILKPPVIEDAPAAFIPEVLTPLAFTPVYEILTPQQQIRYNQLHGLYFLEQTIFFEQLMGRPALKQLARIAPTPELRSEASRFADEEDIHSAWFRTLLREVAPADYQDRDYFHLGASKAWRAAMSFAASRVRRLPALLWLQLIAEERAVYFGRLFLDNAECLDPRFVAVQRRHLADEPSHIRRDVQFIEWLWPATTAFWRRANARLLRWILYEFFRLPVRSGWRVVRHWMVEFPDLAGRRTEFHAAFESLAGNERFLRTLYPRSVFPQTRSLAARWPEMAWIEEFFTD